MKKHFSIFLLAVPIVTAWLLLIPTGHIRADSNDRFLVPSRYFEETGHNVGGPFLAFYETHGGERIFGLPLTEVFEEQGVQVQYFEHMRLEMIANQIDQVTITPLGTWLARNRQDEAAFARFPQGPSDASRFFPSTGHNLSYAFRQFWEEHDGYRLFGSPISEAFIEYNEQDKRSYTVQYFERGRLEYHLEHPGATQQVRVGALGTAYAQSRVAKELLQPARAIEILGTSSIHFTPLPGDIQNISLAARQFDGLRVLPSEEVSYLETVGELTAETGYVPGSGIVGSSMGDVIAGGICYLSTAVFQAVFDAGLAIIERHAHTVLIPDMGDTPGLDSAVYTADAKGLTRDGLYDLDLRWQNDTPDSLIITTDVSTSSLTVSLWGYSDGRETQMKEPDIQYSAPPGIIWRYDQGMPRCGVQRILSGSPGMRVIVEREVQTPDDTLLHEDRFVSFYSPFKDIFLYGPGIEPIYNGLSDSDQLARERCLANSPASNTVE